MARGGGSSPNWGWTGRGGPGGEEISIVALVRNHTLSAEMAAVLWAAVDERLSFLTVAVPQGAGKSTLSNAVLALRRPDVPLHYVYGEPDELDELKRERRGGYIVVGEFSRAPMPGYIWGEPVRRVFDTLAAGYSLQTSLHAPGVEPAIRVVTEGNRVPDDHASAFKLVLYIEVYRASGGGIARRLVDLYELHKVEDGAPVGHSLYRWRPEDDSFQKTSGPHQFGRDAADLARRTAAIEDLVAGGRTSAIDVATAVEAFRLRD